MDGFHALIEGYRRFRRDHWEEEHERWEQLRVGQRPRVMVLACSDSRVDPAQIFDARPGEMFVIRNVAALVPPFDASGRGQHGVVGVDADDILESGIDVIAQPPGKRLQNVLLLSGGEKAMAALALVLGIFHYRPAPFCLLDEVDAPLDEANVGRFTDKVVQMSADTQFIVITHNKRTMEMARALYGVTMEEAGVSKLVSVKFE